MAPTRKGKVDLYALLHAERDFTPQQLRRAYHALARKVHPDKCPDDPNAVKNFQALQRAYDILKDPVRRQQYDRTGCADDESESFWDAYERYRGVEVTAEDIEAFAGQYRESDEERAELTKYYITHKGDVSNILGFVMCSENEDRERFIAYFEEQRKCGALPAQYDEKFEKSKRAMLSIEELDALDDAESIGDEELDEEEEEEEEEEEDMDEEGAVAGFLEEDFDSEESDDEDEEVSLRRQYRIGDRVRAKWRNGPKWYKGVVSAVRRKKQTTYDLTYDDGGEEESVSAALMRPLPSKAAPPTVDATSSSSTAPSARAQKRRRTQAAVGDSFASNNLSEYGDIEALRAKILGDAGGRRAAAFDAFAERYSKDAK